MSNSSPLLSRRSGERYFSAFLLGFGCIFVCLLPVVIADGGYFIYYGDFNAQQIPFYMLANKAVRTGQLGWNWFTDLGTDFLTSYSFYLSGSPFFWLSTLIPARAAVLAMPALLSLKHATAAVTAYAYIRRFVRNKDAALIGGLLYSFSGFQLFNIFFNHFQDVTAFFPLMLIALEELINCDRRGVFAFSVALMGCINYFFFTGQAVFLVIYFIIRIPCSDFNVTWRKFFRLAFEAVLGTMLACFILLPSALTILGNYRVSEFLFGQDMVLYSDKTRLARIIQTFFMPSDVAARPNLFRSENAKWSSIGGYLPLFSMVGVITFIRSDRKHWAVRLSLVCIICAFIPVLNSAFYALNASYYARWFYMPILILAMMTARTLDDTSAKPFPAIGICGIFLAAYSIIALLPKKENGKIKLFDMPMDLWYFGVQFAIAVLCLMGCGFIFLQKKKGKPFMKTAVCMTAAACTACTLSVIIYGAQTPSNAKKYVRAMIKGESGVYENVSEDNFFRVDMSENYDNYPMPWGLPSLRCFQSVVDSSIMEFYDSIGVERNVASRPDTSHYTLRGLCSVKYYYDHKEKYDDDKQPKEPPAGFKKVSENEYFDIYENEFYIEMGFPYDKCVSEEFVDEKSDYNRERMLIKALVLSDEQIKKYSDIIIPASPSEMMALTRSDYFTLCRQKQEQCSESFTFDSYGFESKITLDSPRLVFFSVPYNKGWTAEVNGKPVDVEKVSYGFMAVRAEEGENTITFHYRTYGLATGSAISVSGLLLLMIYLIVSRRRKPSDTVPHAHYYDYPFTDTITASKSYCRRMSDKD